MHAFTTSANWPARLPFTTASRAFILERVGNAVAFSLELYEYVSPRNGQSAIKLVLNVPIQGTGPEWWKSSDADFFVSHGTAQQVAATIAAIWADLRPVQARLAEQYSIAFYSA
ncbi:MAG: hypothetical protein ACRYFX_05080 [Janthinobacterium lividum]